MSSVIYSIRHISSGKRYVGSTADRSKRWSRHRLLLRENRHHSPKLQNAWNKYGSGAFEWEVLEHVEVDQLISREQYYIDLYDSFENGYNIAKVAGSTRGQKRGPRPQEVIEKIRAAQKGRPLSEAHKAALRAAHNPGMTGKKQSEFFKKRMTEVHTGKKISESQIEKYRKTRYENQLTRLSNNPFEHYDSDQSTTSDEK